MTKIKNNIFHNNGKEYQFIMPSLRKLIHREFYGYIIGGINRLVCKLINENRYIVTIKIHLKLHSLLEDLEKEIISWVGNHTTESTKWYLCIKKTYQFNIDELPKLILYNFNRNTLSSFNALVFELINENYDILNKIEKKLFDLLKSSEEVIINWLENHQILGKDIVDRMEKILYEDESVTMN